MRFDKCVSTCNTVSELQTILDEYLTLEDKQIPKANSINMYIFHIHIGSKTMIYIPKIQEQEPEHERNRAYRERNHEYTSFIKTLFNEPKKQFSPEFLSQLSQLTNSLENAELPELPKFNIHNIVLLIDPMYYHSPILEGYGELDEYTNLLDNKALLSENIVQYDNGTITMINTSIEIILVPFDVNYRDIISIIDILNNPKYNLSILINIMDCTSQVLCELYGNNNNKYSNIYITRPDCLILDKLPIYKPIITNSLKNLQAGKISVRWMNHDDDKDLIPELEQILDIGLEQICETHQFLTENYKHNIAIEMLISIVKIWSRLSYTNLQEIDIKPDTTIDGKTILLVKFNEISFTDFITYWRIYTSFRAFILYHVGSDYKYNLNMFLDTFIFKYEEVSSHIHIVKALQIEAIEIFRNLFNYCKTDSAYIISNIKGIEDDTSHLLERKQILEYLKFNNVSI